MKFSTPTADELNLVYDAWANSFRKSMWAGTVPNQLWDTVSRATIGEILNRGARVTVATVDLPDEGARRVMGYSVSEPAKRVLHWVYVKRDYRGMGVGSALLADVLADDVSPWTYSHRTNASSRFLGKQFSHDPTTARVKA